MTLCPHHLLPAELIAATAVEGPEGSIQRRAACGCVWIKGKHDYYGQIHECVEHTTPCRYCGGEPCRCRPAIGGGHMSAPRPVELVV